MPKFLNSTILFLLFSISINFSLKGQEVIRFDGMDFEISNEVIYKSDQYYKTVEKGKIIGFLILKKDGTIVELDNINSKFYKYYFKAYESSVIGTNNGLEYIKYYSDSKMFNLTHQNFLGEQPDGNFLYFVNSTSNSVNLLRSNFDEVFNLFGASNLNLIRSKKLLSKDKYVNEFNNLLTAPDGFYTENEIESKFIFGLNGSLKLIGSSDNKPLIGAYDLESINLTRESLGIEGKGDVSFLKLTTFIGFQKDEYIVYTSECNISSDNVLTIAFLIIGEKVSPNIIYLRRKIDASISLREIIPTSKFLSSMDLLYRGWLGFVIEDSMQEANNEDALEFALDQLLNFPDTKREMYGDILKKIIVEKYKSENN